MIEKCFFFNIEELRKTIFYQHRAVCVCAVCSEASRMFFDAEQLLPILITST